MNRRVLLLLSALCLVGCGMMWRLYARVTGSPNTHGELYGERYVREAIKHLSGTLVHGTDKQRWAEAFATPITFYGKVVDQRGEPVPGAEVKLSANDKMAGPSSVYLQRTAEDGSFSLSGANGIELAVEITKTGYVAIPTDSTRRGSSGVFTYGPSERPHQPSRQTPVIFGLKKLRGGPPVLKVGEMNVRLADNGTPTIISLDQNGGHNVVIRCWSSGPSDGPGMQAYDWRLEVVPEGGGLVVRTDSVDYEAPAEGYVEKYSEEMFRTRKEEWRSFVEPSFFFRFDDGTFARADLRVRTFRKSFVAWESYFNPQINSRVLESQSAAVQ